MSQEIEMETVGSYEMALAGNAMNTIRKMGNKYRGIRPGDQVVMKYVLAPGGEPQAVERLMVRATAVSDFETIVREHWDMNHAHCGSPQQCSDEISRIYGGQVEGQFLAIYFH